MNINIEHITIKVVIQPHEPVLETPRLQEPFKRGHRTHEETQAKQCQLRLEIAERLQRKFRIAEKLRSIFGSDVANQMLAGAL